MCGINDIDVPFSYLGVLLFKGKPTKRVFAGYLDAIKAKMEGW